MQEQLTQVTFKGIKKNEVAYFVRMTELGTPGLEVLVTYTDPAKKSRLINIPEADIVKTINYKKAYHELLEKYDQLDSDTCLPRSNY